MKTIALACACLISTGCAILPSSVKVEAEHVSHPTVGDIFSNRYDEDGLTQANVLGVWRFEDAYFEAGLGKNLKGRNGGGFYGPSFTGTIRVGVEIQTKR